MIMKIPLIVESDYDALKSVCSEHVVGTDYKDYLIRVINRRDSLREIGMEAEFVKISAQPFVAHCDKGRKAEWADLMHYTRLNTPGNSRRTGRRQTDNNFRR